MIIKPKLQRGIQVLDYNLIQIIQADKHLHKPHETLQIYKNDTSISQTHTVIWVAFRILKTDASEQKATLPQS